MSGSATEVVLGTSTTTPKIGRRSMALADIDPKYVSQSGIWEASEVETPRGSIRIQHLTGSKTGGTRPLSTTSGSGFHTNHASSTSSGPSSLVSSSGISGGMGSRFPKLEDCAHFHYDFVDLPQLKFTIREDQLHRVHSQCSPSLPYVGEHHSSEVGIGGNGGGGGGNGGSGDKLSNFSIEVVSNGHCWLLRRTVINWLKLDEQLHRCVWDRKFSCLDNLESQLQSNVGSQEIIERYLIRLTSLPTNQITCGTVLSWFEIDNRGRHIISSDDAALNTPAVAAAVATHTYSAQAPDELSFGVGEMISVIDMPPPEESIWLRGKLTNFEVGFFPRECVEIIENKGKLQGNVPSIHITRRLARVSVMSTNSTPIPDKPVLRKHGKIISFFRSMMSRPEKRVLQQKGILRERVFNCDLAEHLLNTSSEVPVILKTCAEFIEIYGISDGIYRVSGSLRNTQRLRRLFDADEVPNLREDEGIRQDVHAVSSVLKQYFRELPNPLCTYQLYEKFVHAISPISNTERFDRIKEVIKELPPPHYRTLEYLMLHLKRMTIYSAETGMTAQNMAIVWAPNLIRCRDLEGGSAAEFKGVSNHVIVTEFVIRYAERFFGMDKSPLPSENYHGSGRPDSMLLSSASPMKLMSLEAAKEKLGGGNKKFIEVGGGPSSLPPIYHTVIETSKRRPSLKTKTSLGAGGGWKNFFSRNRSFSKGARKVTVPDIRIVMDTARNLKDGSVPGAGHKLRPVRSEESLISSPYGSPSACGTGGLENTLEVDESRETEDPPQSTSSPASPVSENYSLATGFLRVQPKDNLLGPTSCDSHLQDPSKTHNRSISHDSYFESTIKQVGLIPNDIQEEQSPIDNSKFSLEISSPETVAKENSSGMYADCESNSSSRATRNPSSIGSDTPPPLLSSSNHHTPSLRPSKLPINEFSTSSDNSPIFQKITVEVKGELEIHSIPNSPIIRPKPKPRLSKLRDCQVQTSTTAMNDVGVSTMDEGVSPFDSEFSSSFISVTHTNNRSDVDIYGYPTFSEIEKHEISLQHNTDEYELDRNSSLDTSSTDTTPGCDPYVVTNIIYSPLVNDPSSPTESTSSIDEPISVNHRHIVQAQDLRDFNVCNLMEAHYENLPPPRETPAYANIVNTPGSSSNSFNTFNTTRKLFDNRIMNGTEYINLDDPKSTKLIDEISGNGLEICDKFDLISKEEFFEDRIGDKSDEEFPDENSCDEGHHNYNTGISFTELFAPLFTLESFQVESTETVEVLSSPSSESSNVEDEDEIIEVSSGVGQIGIDCITYLEIKDQFSEKYSSQPTDDSTSAEITPTSPQPEEIRHIDSPLLVDNPLYGFPSVDIDSEIISREVEKMSRAYQEEYAKEPVECKHIKRKLECRSISAPLDETSSEIPQLCAATNECCDTKVLDRDTRNDSRKINRTSSMVRDHQRLLLCKRLSDPSLNIPGSDSDSSAWKTSDAKRLTHRKQSVRELLTKFESTSQEVLLPAQSPTRSGSFTTQSGGTNINNGMDHMTSLASKNPSPVGLPRPPINTQTSTPCLRDRNNTRYQYHRFSMGDILMSKSLGSSEDKNSMSQSGSGSMTRSDTFPELRNEASKENESSQLDYSEKGLKKMLHLFEVTNATVDNSDPHTRERIEKYKNNRRLFLREKYSGAGKTEDESYRLSSSVRTSTSSNGSTGGHDGETSPSIDSVFGNNDRNSASSGDSPRKRALSEDNSVHLLQSHSKTFKSEEERLNTPPKVEISDGNIILAKSDLSKKNSNTAKLDRSNSNPPLSCNSRLNIRSCPPGGLRHEVITVTATTTVSSTELPNKNWASSPSIPRHPLSSVESGKKIKDIAAFFERKQF